MLNKLRLKHFQILKLAHFQIKVMNIKETLKKSNILSVYFTAGHPNLHDTTTIIAVLEHSGADLIEVGLPFSDPMADGPIIQESSVQALKNGITPDIVFQQLSRMKDRVSVPLVLMGYLNQMLVYGEEAFLKKCSEVGIKALILPDLPPEEYLANYQNLYKKYNLLPVFLITPQTTDARIRLIDSIEQAFIYVVAQASVTGAKGKISIEQNQYFERIYKMNLTHPTLIGFGISDNLTFMNACNFANGAIIGSAFIKHISQAENLPAAITEFISIIR